MDILDYINLSDEAQVDILFEVGEQIDTIKTIGMEYPLFTLFNFFVEITVVTKDHSGLRLSPFTSGERLNRYSHDLILKPKPWD